MNSDIDEFLDQVDQWKSKVQQQLKERTPKRRAAFWARMGQRAREFIFQNYTWDQAARKTHEVYTAMLNHEPMPYRFDMPMTETQKLERRAV